MLPYFVSRWERTILKQNEALILAATPNMSHLSLRAVYSVIKYSKERGFNEYCNVNDNAKNVLPI